MVGQFGPQVAGDAISAGNEKTIEGYVVLNFEVTSRVSEITCQRMTVSELTSHHATQ